jgi:DNA modification methylase
MQDFENQIVCGDCIALLKKAEEPFADLVFADPPFNIGFTYDRYKDDLEAEHYIDWTRDWMAECVRILKPQGSFYIAIGDDYAADVRLIGRELGLTLRNWIIWHYTFGQQTKMKFARAHTHVFYFVRDAKQFTFNDWAVRVPSDRQLIYADKRANPLGKLPDDVWNQYSRVCGTFLERQGWHPCQMPEILLARIIAASSNAGDLVLDPFSGSGTTAAVARLMGRRYAGIDISDDYVVNSRQRIATIHESYSCDCGPLGTLDSVETLELRRLYAECGIELQSLIDDPKLMKLFCRQFTARMNNDKGYDPALIAEAVKKIAYSDLQSHPVADLT